MADHPNAAKLRHRRRGHRATGDMSKAFDGVADDIGWQNR